MIHKESDAALFQRHPSNPSAVNFSTVPPSALAKMSCQRWVRFVSDWSATTKSSKLAEEGPKAPKDSVCSRSANRGLDIAGALAAKPKRADSTAETLSMTSFWNAAVDGKARIRLRVRRLVVAARRLAPAKWYWAAI